MSRVVWESEYEYTPRGLKHQAESTVGKNPVFAIVELITNSDVAYTRLEKMVQKHRGVIIIDVVPKKEGSVFSVTDYATGMDEDDFKNKVIKIGGDTSGLTPETGGRSFWGRGLKEVMIDFGRAKIVSIKNGYLYNARSSGTKFQFLGRTPAGLDDYNDLECWKDGNCTRVSLIATDSASQKTPHIDKLADILSHYFELRDLLEHPNRKVVVRYLRSGEISRQIEVKRERTSAKQIAPKNLVLEGFPKADAVIEVFKSDTDLPDTGERHLRERGFLIASKNAIWATESFGFDAHPASPRIFGRITSFYIDHLLREEDAPLFDPSRTGAMNMKQIFCQALYKAAFEVLKPIYEEELEKQIGTEGLHDEDLDRRTKRALSFLDSEAKKLLGEKLEIDKGTTKKPVKPKLDLPPPNGFDFMPPYVQISPDKPCTLTLKLAPRFAQLRTKKLILKSTNKSINLIPKALLWEYNAKGFWVVRPRVSGSTLGEQGKIIASLGDLNAEVVLEVVKHAKGSGLFSEYKIERGYAPEQRVLYIRGSGLVIISADSPSVRSYVLPKEKLKQPPTRLLIAELILQACCQEIARQMILRGKEPILIQDPNGIAEQTQALYVRLMNRFAKPVQDYILGS